ncbi:phosphatase PAP2 family protein [Streptomyces sp. PmtG]
MSPDAEFPPPSARGPRATLAALDRRVFDVVATRHWPGADQVLPRLSRAANHGGLWFATAAVLAATRRPGARRAAVRGAASLALASAAINTLGKRTVRRQRPRLDGVPLMRRLKRQPVTTSFPSGHAASAAAFATGVALESRSLGAAVAPLAGAVGLSRVYTGVHFPSDVLAGAALGALAAYAVRGLMPTRSQLPPPGRPRAEAPALPGGRGLVVVVNSGARSPERVRALLDALPHAEAVTCTPDEVAAALDKAAARARALGVCGGDGTVNAAAAAALRHAVPLVVVPGGTLNHFALDVGAEDPREVARAVEAGDAVAVDVGRFSAGRGDGYFLNTFSLGVYPELVRERARWSPRIGGWPAGVLAAARVLRSDQRPLRAEFRGTERALWLLFAGNCVYHRLGLNPARRFDLADGLLDVRVVHGGRRPGARLLAAALTSPVERSPVQTAVRRRTLRVESLGPGTAVAYDGELTRVEGELLIEKLPEALTVYRPSPTS